MSKSMEKQLNKTGMMEVYNEHIKDLLNRGCIEPVSSKEIKEWNNKGGKFSYISHHPVITANKVTTRCRIVINSSLKNSGNGPLPNDNWPKGPNALKPMYEVFVRFHLYEVVVHFDLSKMFHSVQTGEPEKFMRLMVWRDGKQTQEWQVYGWKVVTFGD